MFAQQNLNIYYTESKYIYFLIKFDGLKIKRNYIYVNTINTAII